MTFQKAFLLCFREEFCFWWFCILLCERCQLFQLIFRGFCFVFSESNISWFVHFWKIMIWVNQVLNKQISGKTASSVTLTNLLIWFDPREWCLFNFFFPLAGTHIKVHVARTWRFPKYFMRKMENWFASTLICGQSEGNRYHGIDKIDRQTHLWIQFFTVNRKIQKTCKRHSLKSAFSKSKTICWETEDQEILFLP